MESMFKKNASFLVIFGMMIFVRSTFANEYVVPSGSMEPTIAIGDRIFVNRVAYDLKLPFTNTILEKLHEPERGSIVVFESPKEKGLVLVKRLIAVPGDEVEIRNGLVYLNGKETTDHVTPDQVEFMTTYTEVIGNYRHKVQRISEYFRPDHFHFWVGNDQFFMMGDNRDNSADGRYFGLVKRELLIGQATHVIFSVDFSKPILEMIALNRTGQALL
jgi:signal peptidase I